MTLNPVDQLRRFINSIPYAGLVCRVERCCRVLRCLESATEEAERESRIAAALVREHAKAAEWDRASGHQFASWANYLRLEEIAGYASAT